MANEEHRALLKQGIDHWNTWRTQNPDVSPDLSGIHLNSTDLSGANLSSTDLSGTHLSHANLSSTNLSGAHLSGTYLANANLSHANLTRTYLANANLSSTNLSYADLSYADLTRADLIWANLHTTNLRCANLTFAKLISTDLSHADLSQADLYYTHLSQANLRATNFSLAHFDFTTLACVDLSETQGLDTIIHEGPSFIDIKTIKLPQGEERRRFLQSVGFSDTFIEHYDSLFPQPLPYESCFISYSSWDKALAQRIYKDLQDKGVRCWFAPHDFQWARWYANGIYKAISLHTKVLLLFSQAGAQTPSVDHEMETLLSRTIDEHADLLYPLWLDDAMMQATIPWAKRLRENPHSCNFTNWQDEDSYRQHFDELLRHLKVKPT